MQAPYIEDIHNRYQLLRVITCSPHSLGSLLFLISVLRSCQSLRCTVIKIYGSLTFRLSSFILSFALLNLTFDRAYLTFDYQLLRVICYHLPLFLSPGVRT